MKIPTLAEVQAYFTEKDFYNGAQEAEKFYDYNLSVGWIVGKKRTPMKDWQAAARTWNRNAIEYAKEKGAYKPPPPPKSIPADNKERVFMPEGLFAK